jgi:ring-1,2-phenylacetyl-CoA epoxidase subunit PaaC
VERADVAVYCLMLGDDALVLSHRLSEWCSRAPDLEEDVALANVALDLLGQARLLLARAAAAEPAVVPALPAGSPVPAEDALAFFRDDRGFRNVRMAEVADGDFGGAVARLLLLSTWRLALLQRLAGSRDAVLAAVAAKGVKELTYHRDFAGRWFVVLARGTAESRRRLVAGLHAVWPLYAELFVATDVERRLAEAGVGVDPADVEIEVGEVLTQVLDAAQVPWPANPAAGGVDGRGGRDGVHTEELARVLAEMQVVARAHPTGRW